ncbi:hypothetical protein [Nonomuraea sp. GTA35]|uniref:hypothetical protein n=1 Tax=Nonomuraea sp. GTA35 TaxID=1676746 RepID=UPI0035C00321
MERGNFAKKAEHRINHYFAEYVPPGMDRDQREAETEGIRRSLRDELTEVYGEPRVGVEKIAWLIRHRAGKAATRRRKGTLWSYRRELATPFGTKARATLGLLTLAGAGGWAAVGIVPIEPLPAIGTILLLLIAGWFCARTWLPQHRHLLPTASPVGQGDRGRSRRTHRQERPAAAAGAGGHRRGAHVSLASQRAAGCEQ